MRQMRTRRVSLPEQPYFKKGKIEEICAEALKTTNLYPSCPEPIRIDRFVEKQFGIAPEYDDLPEGVLGFTKFGPRGVEAIVVATALDQGGGKVTERRLRSTLAHEGGHGLLHARLFQGGEKPRSMFDGIEDQTPRILCRDVPDATPEPRAYDGRWWEFHANKAIGGLLMPRGLVELALDQFCVDVGLLGQRTLMPGNREAATRALADIFDVNPTVARLRIDDVFPQKNEGQLAL